MNSAPKTTPNIIPTESRSAPRGREVQLTFVAHTGDNWILLRFSMGNEEYTECFDPWRHWEFVQEVGDRCPVMVAKYSFEQEGPIHMFWKFTVSIGVEYENYGYYTYRHDTHTRVIQAAKYQNAWGLTSCNPQLAHLQAAMHAETGCGHE